MSNLERDVCTTAMCIAYTCTPYNVLLVIDAHALISLALDWAWGGLTLKVPQLQFYRQERVPRCVVYSNTRCS